MQTSKLRPVLGCRSLLPPLLLSALLLGASGPPPRGRETPVVHHSLPAWLPPPLIPVSSALGRGPSEVLVELGRRLFYDLRLSGSGDFSCASCHRQELAFTDGRARAKGATGELHSRSAMSLTNVAYNATYNWANPGLRDLESQALNPMLNEHPVEMGVAGREEEVLDRQRQDPVSADLFRRAFPDRESSISLETVTRALAAFQRTLISTDSPYDRAVFNDDWDGMSAAARRGMGLFFSERLGCFKCHGGFSFSGPVKFFGGDDAEATFHNTGLYNLGGRGLYPATDQGLISRTGRQEDMGRFRAPTLRNIEVTAPYMHDGSIATLEEVVDHYAAGGRTIFEGPNAGLGAGNPYKSELVTGFQISEAQRADLVEFLRSLTDRTFLEDPRFSDPFRPPSSSP